MAPDTVNLMGWRLRELGVSSLVRIGPGSLLYNIPSAHHLLRSMPAPLVVSVNKSPKDTTAGALEECIGADGDGGTRPAWRGTRDKITPHCSRALLSADFIHLA